MKRAFVMAALLLSSTAHAEEAALPNPDHASPLRARAFGGVAHGSLFGMPVTGPSGGASFGGGLRRSWGGVDGFVDIAYDALSTPHDVGVRRLALGFTGEVVWWHLRAGAGWDVGSAWIARLSSSKVSASQYFLGVHATLGVDLFTVGGLTPYVQGRAEYNTAFPTFGANGGLRYAF